MIVEQTMNLSIEKRKISNYLLSNKSWPVFVDLQNKDDLADLLDYFSVGNNVILKAEEFCALDGTFKLEEFYNAISNNKGDTFIVGLTAFLKIQGEAFTQSVLKNIVSKSVSGHIVIVTYQCKNYLKFTDTRYFERGQIIISNNEPDVVPSICLISPQLAGAFNGSYIGFKKVSSAIEESKQETVYIATDIAKKTFPNSVFTLLQMNNGYDILCNRDPRTKTVPPYFGTPDQWNYALKLMGSANSWADIVNMQFSSIANLSQCVKAFTLYDDFKQWLYYISLSIFGAKDNEYLQLSVNNASDYKSLLKSLFRTILTVDRKDGEFEKLYDQRKNIIKDLTDSVSEIIDFCKVSSVKEKDSIYYLTDLTQPEKERIIEWLDCYGQEYQSNELRTILKKVYPDLASYLIDFRYKNTLLDDYFAQYKYQKVINKILPSFESVVDEQSRAFGFVDALKSRTSIVEKIDVTDALAYFVDALGVEYLGYIQEKCLYYGLSLSVICGKCELPSLTPYNKEFVETLNNKGCKIIDIKDLDEIKHHGEDNYDYEKVKTPLYLIKELEIIDNLLKIIKAKIQDGTIKKAIVISDHGASRLAVLHNTENVWKMATTGIHSGRCCPKSDINTKPDFAIEAEGFWVLANYDRFQGGRKANCEVHGGASLEEVAVPIMEITQKKEKVEAFITEPCKTFILGAKEYPEVKIYVAIKSDNISIRLNGEYFDAAPSSEKYIYTVILNGYDKKGTYVFDIFNGAEMIAENQTFEIKRKGMSEHSLFD